jgi:hypothetical protein
VSAPTTDKPTAGPLLRALHRYLPAHFHDPLGLAARLLRSGDPAARFAMLTTGLGVLATPLDVLLSIAERRRIGENAERRFPLILVCGPPRSGTTLVYQTLVRHLSVAYFTNLSAVFPRSPLTSWRLAGRLIGTPDDGYDNFYGKTTRLGGTNDALTLWDRWLGGDRTHVPTAIQPAPAAAMRQFFAACDDTFGRPLVNKNNSLNLTAHLVAECVENVVFICLNRERLPLAQSLYRARREILGTLAEPYGATADSCDSDDAIRSVCRQVLGYEQVHREQVERLGAERFWNIGYEEFCRNPAALVHRVANEVLGHPQAVRGMLPATFQISPSHGVDVVEVERMRQVLDELGG